MKKITLCLMATCLSLTLLPLQLNAASNVVTNPKEVTKPLSSAESAEAKVLTLRLDEINAMDKSELKAAEKKSLRKEVRTINHSLKTIGGGVYISAGAAILIIVLLIILL
jgi:hypothetical protein